MNNINKMFDGLGGALGAGAVNPLVGTLGAGAMNPLGAAFGLGATAPAAAAGGAVGAGVSPGTIPDYSYVDNLPDTVPDMQIPNVSVPASVQAVDVPSEEFDYSKMLKSISESTGKLSESSEPAAAPSMGVARGAAQSGPPVNPYAVMSGTSPAMSAIQNSRPMIGAQPSIEQILQSLAR